MILLLRLPTVIPSGDVIDSFGGFFLALGLFGMLYLSMRGKMGLGDVILAPILAIAIPAVVVPWGILVGASSALVFVLVRSLVRRVSLREAIPFAPFLIVGFAVARYFSSGLAGWTDRIFMPS